MKTGPGTNSGSPGHPGSQTPYRRKKKRKIRYRILPAPPSDAVPKRT